MSNSFAFIQARMGSKRLYGKVLRPLVGLPLIGHLCMRLSALKSSITPVYLIPKTKENAPLKAYLKSLNELVFEGDENHVLSRFYKAALKYQPKTIIRLTGDCPLVQPDLIEEMLKEFDKSSDDYLSNVLKRTYPKGFDVEIFSFEALKKAFSLAKDPYEIEHVTPYIYRNPHLFKLKNFESDLEPSISHLNLSVDTLEDFKRVENLIKKHTRNNPLFGLKELFDDLEFTRCLSTLKNTEAH